MGGRKTKKAAGGGNFSAAEERIFAPWRRLWLAGGAFSVAAGMGLLLLTDARGGNWASTLAPWLILGGYGGIAVGIFLPEELVLPSPAQPETPSKDPS